jgi:cobalt-precorrin-5B (C1)-methyltransferase
MANKIQDISRSPSLGRKGLRRGYTTGTCAAAATKLALSTLIESRKVSRVTIPLPKGDSVTLSASWIKMDKGAVTAAVIKDGGDDPDVTNGAEICSTVSVLHASNETIIDGGKGVGRVTKPGLGLKIGTAAINPVPLKMIKGAIEDVMKCNQTRLGVRVLITVPKGEEIAKKTDNPRLGIIGGISILGTSGIVIPYSTSSFAASIRQAMDVSAAMGSRAIVLTTGGRSEDFAQAFLGREIPEHSFIQVGDFIGYAVRESAIKKMETVYVGGFIGKLTKMAMGVKQTHVRGSHVDMLFLANQARFCGLNDEIVSKIESANTARHVAEIVDSCSITGFYDSLCKEAHNRLSNYCDYKVKIYIMMFNFDGKVIGMYPERKLFKHRKTVLSKR